jgi:hypothetical protein
MAIRNTKHIVMFSIVALLSICFVDFTNVFAEEEREYKMVGDVTPVLTFTFRDGIETLEFPVFEMNENFADNSGVSFSVEGSVTNSPLLHEALDESYKYRFSNAAFDYQFKYFDVNADFVKDDTSIISLDYANCRVDNYHIETLDSNDFESYFKEVGFAVVDMIDFVCSGVNSSSDVSLSTESFTNYGESEFTYANNMKTSVTFIYDYGSEQIEFPVFNLVSAYAESVDNVVAEFSVEGLLEYYPLLYRTIDISRSVSGNSNSINLDFDALVEFTNGNDTLRGFEFKKCIVSDAKITTQRDKEEGFTGKSAFVLVQQLGFTCSGLSPVNMYYDQLKSDTPRSAQLTNVFVEPIQNTDQGLKTISTFTFPDGIETVEFSMFKQNEILTSTEKVNDDNGQKALAADAFTRKVTYPTIEFRGIVGDYPLLYNHVDENRKIQGVVGTQMKNLVDIDVDIIYDEQVIRGFNYVNCRAINYDVDSNANKEESYAKNKFALENLFDFECQGYHPNNPTYDAMYAVESADTESSKDLRNTDRWSSLFTVRE